MDVGADCVDLVGNGSAHARIESDVALFESILPLDSFWNQYCSLLGSKPLSIHSALSGHEGKHWEGPLDPTKRNCGMPIADCLLQLWLSGYKGPKAH
jgi:hypothetical protein